MAVYCRQKDILLKQNVFIYAQSLITGRIRRDQLKVWLEVEDYEKATGAVHTRAGIWRYADLEFIRYGSRP